MTSPERDSTSTTQNSETPYGDVLGLSVDMLDVDRLRGIAARINGDHPLFSDFLEDLANRLDTTVREIGVLRQKAGVVPHV